MQEALKEMVLLVWVSSETTRWPILWANKTWTQATGVRVIPTSRFPGVTKVLEPGAESGAARSNLNLWDHLLLSSVGADEVQMLVACVKDATEGTATRTFGLAAKLASLPSGESSASRTMLCRFSPADQSIDAAAAVIRPSHSQGQWSSKGGIHPTGLPPGRLYFVTIKPVRPDLTSDTNPGSLSSMENLGSRNSGMVSSQMMTGDSKGLSNTTGLSNSDAGDSTSSGTRKKVGMTSDLLKPVRSPFEDVRLINKVGAGSFGEVYLGLWIGASVAVKVIKGALAEGFEQSEASFEASLAASIAHPNVVQTYKHSTRIKDQSDLVGHTRIMETWIIQEWCDRGTLRAFCNIPRVEGKRLREALELAIEVAQGLAYVHDRGIIHGDLTPNNVMLKSNASPKGVQCKVCDFGLARVLETDSEASGIRTETMGTVTHMPPELFSMELERRVITRKADIYALGIIMHEAVCGQKPFAGLSPPQVVIKIASGKTLELPAAVHQDLVTVYKACIMKSAQGRPRLSEVIQRLTVLHLEMGDPDATGGDFAASS